MEAESVELIPGFVDRDEKKLLGWIGEALKPEPILTVSEWADEHRLLSRKAASEPGRWRTQRTPYLKEIMDCLSISNPVKVVVFQKASQIGGTETGLNWLGYIIDHAPGPTLVVWPRVDDGRKNSKLRIDPLIDENPRLKSKVGSIKSRDSSNTILQKSFVGGELVITGANSAAGLKSMPARFNLMDEIDEYPHDVEGQGDPIKLVEARSRTFSRRKSFLISTPTIRGASKIEDEYATSDQRNYVVPCPDCGHKQKLDFEQLDWDYDRESGEVTRCEYACIECGVLIPEHKKTLMLEGGEWIANFPERKKIGFFINSLYSPVGWFGWADIARDYEEAKCSLEEENKTEKMRTFVNTVLGISYDEPGESPEWERLYMRREDYETGIAPEGTVLITCGADVQADRIECEVIGFGRNEEVWSIDYRVFMGDTAQEAVWDEFRAHILRPVPHENGKLLPISFTTIDSGYRTSHVYNFCRKFPASKVAPVKGSENMAMAVGVPKITDFRHNGRQYKRGVRLWLVGVNVLKSEIYGKLGIDPPTDDGPFAKGYYHFPEYQQEYFKQLTAEKIVVKRDRKGFSVTEFVKTRERNEALDCRCYALAAGAILGIPRFKEQDWLRVEQRPPVANEEKTDNNNGNTKKARAKKKKSKSDYW